MKRQIRFKRDVTLDEIRRLLNHMHLHIMLDEEGNLQTNKSFIKSMKRHLVEEEPDDDDWGDDLTIK